MLHNHNFTKFTNFESQFHNTIQLSRPFYNSDLGRISRDENHKKTFNQEDDAPEPLGEEGWLDLNLPVQLMRNLIHLKMAKPTPIQRIACPGKAF